MTDRRRPADYAPARIPSSSLIWLLMAVLVCGLALEAAMNRHTTTLPILVVLSLIGFVSSVTIARFTPGSDDVEAGES